MATCTKDELINRFASAKGKLLLFGCGAGVTGKMAEEGGADAIGFLSDCYFQKMGYGSNVPMLGLCDNNRIILDMAKQISPVIKKVPLFAGVLFNNLMENWSAYFEQLTTLGISAVMNYPSAGIHEGRIDTALREANMSIELEAENMKKASDFGFYTIGYAYRENDALVFSSQKMDMVVLSFDDADTNTFAPEHLWISEIGRITDRIKSLNKEIKVLVHGDSYFIDHYLKAVYADTAVDGLFCSDMLDKAIMHDSIVTNTFRFKHNTLSEGGANDVIRNNG